MYSTSTKPRRWENFARHASLLALLVLFLGTWATVCTSRSIAKVQPQVQQPDVLESSNTTFNLITRNLKDDSTPAWYTGPDPNTTPDTQLSAEGKMIKKGNLLLCMMRAAIGSPLVLPTQFANPSSLAANGWSPTWITPNPDITTCGLNLAFLGAGVSYSPQDWVKVDYQHSKSSTIEGKMYPATQATYSNSISLADGALLAEHNYGPGYSIQATGGKGTPPPLARWSDVVLLAWKQAIAKYPNLNGDLSKIQHIFRWSINEFETRQKIEDITGKSLSSYGVWPGMSFPIDSNQAKALLTVDNAVGVAWLLAQHKDNMGVKAIDRIAVFDCGLDTGFGHMPQLCMYFHISPVPMDQRA